jgi:hypothetical protein
MFRRLALLSALAAFLIGFPVGSAAATNAAHNAVAATKAALQLFTTESAAQAHCPSDKVVWLNTRSGIYHYKGER